MTLKSAALNTSYSISSISADTDEMQNFLFSLGCYPGEKITVISRLAENLIVNIKNARYSIDALLADSISIENEVAVLRERSQLEVG